jgi:hypothetical protein
MEKNKEELELLRYGFNTFNFIIIGSENLSFKSFANIIENYSESLKAKEIAKTYRKYKGVVSKNELIIDFI